MKARTYDDVFWIFLTLMAHAGTAGCGKKMLHDLAEMGMHCMSFNSAKQKGKASRKKRTDGGEAGWSEGSRRWARMGGWLAFDHPLVHS